MASDPQIYDVILESISGNAEDATERLAARFGVDRAEAARIVSTAPVAVKQGADLETARVVGQHLVAIGAEVSFRPCRPEAPHQEGPEPPTPSASSFAGPAQGRPPAQPLPLETFPAVPAPQSLAMMPPPESAPAAQPGWREKLPISLSPRGLALVTAAVVAFALFMVCRTPTMAGLSVHRVGGRGSNCPTVILLHGFGAPGDDLVGFAETLLGLGLPEETRFLMPEGIVRVGFGRAWWNAPGQPPPELVDSRGRLADLIGELVEDGTPAEHIVIAGFSQGATMAREVALSSRPPVGGAAILSGGDVPGATDPSSLEPTTTRYFVSHGQRDQVLPFRTAQRAAEQMQQAGYSVEWNPFEGGHEVRPVETALAAFIAQVIEAPPSVE